MGSQKPAIPGLDLFAGVVFWGLEWGHQVTKQRRSFRFFRAREKEGLPLSDTQVASWRAAARPLSGLTPSPLSLALSSSDFRLLWFLFFFAQLQLSGEKLWFWVFKMKTQTHNFSPKSWSCAKKKKNQRRRKSGFFFAQPQLLGEQLGVWIS